MLERPPFEEDFESAQGIVANLKSSIFVDGFEPDILKQRIHRGFIDPEQIQLEDHVQRTGGVAPDPESALLVVQGIELKAERTPNRDDQLLPVENLVPVDDKKTALIKRIICLI